MKSFQSLQLKPSALVRLALRDEEKAHTSRRYRVVMRAWHKPGKFKCAVCFAGAVMAFTLDADPMHDLCPEWFDHNTSNCLLALNYFRIGNVYEGLYTMGLSDMGEKRGSHRELDREVTPYADDRDAFRAEMEKIAMELEAIDL